MKSKPGDLGRAVGIGHGEAAAVDDVPNRLFDVTEIKTPGVGFRMPSEGEPGKVQ